MEIAIFIVIFVAVGILLSRLARLIGLKIFRFLDIYNFFLKFIKRNRII